MTQKAFFEKLAKLPQKWRLVEGGLLRYKDWDCPIIAVFNATFPERAGEFDNSEYRKAALDLKLNITVAGKIATAADWYNHPYRDRLLDACGLQEDK